MPALGAIKADKLSRLIGTPGAPVLIDLRPAGDFVPGAMRRDAERVAEWAAASLAGRSVIVICDDGGASAGVAAWLRHAGADAELLEGGVQAWVDAGLPLVREDVLPPRDAAGATRWITRARPKVGRIACPWLIRRFVDPEAVILFAAPNDVVAAGERLYAAPFDVEGVFWSHRGEFCTFDTMVEELGLAGWPGLARLAMIVRGADTARPEIAPQAAGLLAASLGLSRMYADDHPCAGRNAMRGSRGVTHAVSLREAFWTWARVAALSFGGPAGQIAVMHRILVEEKRWIGEHRFLHALNYCMLLPGPEAQQLATYVGWLMHKTRGGIVAGGLFILPGIVSIMALSWLYVLYGRIGVVSALFFGLKAAVLAIVLQAVARIGSRALKNTAMRALAASAFVLIFFLAVPFPVIVLGAGLIGYIGGRAGNTAFAVGGVHGARAGAIVEDADTLLGEDLPDHARPTARHSLGVAALWLLLWLTPVAALVLLLGPDDTFSGIAIFFSKMAMVTFGGAYAVLAYVAQQAVDQYHWLRPKEMLDGLGMAETTPGPLIMVLQFVGFLGAYRDPGGLSPLLAGTLGGLLATWVTFTPCFLWIFLGAPFIERLRGNRALAGALSAITAAVVGVILNLAIWFAIHTIFRQTVATDAGPVRFDMPVFASVDPWALLLSIGAVIAMFRFRTGMLATLAASSAAGMLLHLLGAI